MTAPDSFYDELARLQQAPGLGRLESVVSYLRSRNDEPWPTWASALERADVRIESDPLSFELGRCSPAAKALAASTTLTRLTSISFTWEGLDGEGVAALVRSPVTKLCTSVTFDFCTEGGSGQDAALSAFAEPSFARSIRQLSLRGDSLDAGHAATLAGYEWLASLTALDLGHMEAENELGDDGAKTLAECRHLSGLRSLGLAGCGLTDDGAKALLASPHLKTCSFDLEDNDLSGEILEQALARDA